MQEKTKKKTMKKNKFLVQKFQLLKCEKSHRMSLPLSEMIKLSLDH